MNKLNVVEIKTGIGLCSKLRFKINLEIFGGVIGRNYRSKIDVDFIPYRAFVDHQQRECFDSVIDSHK